MSERAIADGMRALADGCVWLARGSWLTHDRACIVTGASRGIGRATAVTLASTEGAAVLLVGRRAEALVECSGRP